MKKQKTRFHCKECTVVRQLHFRVIRSLGTASKSRKDPSYHVLAVTLHLAGHHGSDWEVACVYEVLRRGREHPRFLEED
jgi:hypothetical protein